MTVEGYIDDALRNQKNDEWEGKGDGKGDEAPIVYPIAYGGSVADFALEPTPKNIVDSPAELAAVSQYAGQTVYVATGTYALTAPLDVPAGTTLVGGYNPETGVVDPLATPTRLRLDISAMGGKGIVLGKGAELNGFALEGNKNVPVLIQAADSAAGTATVRNCIFVSQPMWGASGAAYVAQGLTLTTCVFFAIEGALLNDCAVSHCTFAGNLPAGCSDDGGNQTQVASRRPIEPSVCEAGHECPEYGLDGRPLGGNLGALAPDSFEFTPETLKALGYRLRLK